MEKREGSKRKKKKKQKRNREIRKSWKVRRVEELTFINVIFGCNQLGNNIDDAEWAGKPTL